MSKMKLKEWADKNGLSYLTANRHFHAGMIPNAVQLDSGTILVEDDSSEQNMMGNTSNDAISLFLKKTVEFSKNSSTVEDFAAYVISNFQLRINHTPENPRYSKQKPKSEEVQKHFQQFIPKQGEKPKPNSFVMNPEDFEEIPSHTTITRAEADLNTRAEADPNLVQEFSQAVSFASVYTDEPTPYNAGTPSGIIGAMSTESTVTQSVDLNSTPQSINYTGSNNLAFSSSLSSTPTILNANADFGSIFNIPYLVGQVQPNSSESVNSVFVVQSDPTNISEETNTAPPRSKRGRKPNKK